MPDKFPEKLPEPNEEVLKKVGEYLKDCRGKTPVKSIALDSDTETRIIDQIEAGKIHCSLGVFRNILRKGYKIDFEELLSKCHEKFTGKPSSQTHLEYDFDYFIRYNFSKPHELFVAGEPGNFLWAVPFKRLKNQPASVDLLELAKARVRTERGKIPAASHDGFELIHVISGSIKISFGDMDNPEIRELHSGESLFFNSSRNHQVTNTMVATIALLLVVRLGISSLGNEISPRI